MKTKYILSVWFIFLHISLYAQITFQKTYGDTLEQYTALAKQCLDNGYIIVSSSFYNLYGQTPQYNTTMFVVRTNEYGDTLWTRKLEPNLPDKLAYTDVIQTSDGGFVLCGSNGNQINLTYIYLSKLDANGKTIWIWSAGCDGYGGSFQQTFDEGFIIVSDYAIYRTDADGKQIWCKHAGNGDPYLPLNYVIQSVDSNFIVTGSTNGLSITNLLKFDAGGSVIWHKYFDYLRPSGGHNLIETKNKEYYILGNSKYFSVLDSMYHFGTCILKTNFDGDSIGLNSYPYTLRNTFLIETKDEGYAFTGNTISWNDSHTLNSNHLVKVDANGEIQWTQIYSFQDTVHIFSLNETADGGFIMAGSIKAIPGNLHDIVLIKTDSFGNILISNTKELHRTIEVKVNPNPFNSSTTVQFNTPLENASIIIYNLYGQVVRSMQNIFTHQVEIVREGLPAGLYFISIIKNQNVIATEKLIITD